ncbi:PorP/SprF family type IX secretion system membrane protein [Flagellimonas onchidii]|uniref:PorP/SprF family type IX secretion system membrane protein n=1 Tax=Flagellimonas onchidii TaxID=2562684 RepID=UPI0010A6B3F6|nr:PorP/SprF family type IX secretion system membrane protein [Allomuricauda onchidii]
MSKFFVVTVLLLISCFSSAQEVDLPADFRQHNLTQFNANLLNATYSLDWNNPNSLSVWSRWQWQSIDGDPTSLFINYTHGINLDSSFGVGFLQHNTGVYLNTGANLNYVHAISLDGVRLFFGANVFGFQQKLADDAVIPDGEPPREDSSGFIVTASPAVRLQADGFGLGLAIENAADFSLSKDTETESTSAFIGTISYDFPVALLSSYGESHVRPIIYMKSISGADTQFGINGLLSTPIFWVQGGYNNFYGPSGGVGFTLARQFSIGALLEFATDDAFGNEKSTLELVASYHFGKSDARKKVVGFDVDKDDELALARIRAEEERKEREALEAKKIQDQQEAQRKVREEQIRVTEEERKEQQRQQQLLAEQERQRDSIALAQQEAQRLLLEEKRKDSIAQIRQQVVEVKPNEKYQEVTDADGLEPGFYLIANVFGTKRYFENFIATLKKKGLSPKSFYRSQNKFNYVYLERYDTMQEARKARDSKFFGKYSEKTWIFRVRRD